LFHFQFNDTCLRTGVFIVLLIPGLVLNSCQPLPVEKEKVTSETVPIQEAAETANEEAASALVFENKSVTSSTNIHYTGKYCNECHVQTPVEGGDKYLKFNGDYRYLCRCHENTSSLPIHPFDIKPSLEKEKRMPPDFPLENGKVTCKTCHNIYLQCQKRMFGKNSLRGAPYARRTDFCYKCHEEKRYQRLNPHEQINKDGEVIIEKCLFCHKEKPDQAHATFKEVKFIGNIEALCIRCHPVAGNHAGNFNHMGVLPSPGMLKNMKAMEKKFNLILPLDEDGKMTCITCHNPHEKGIIPEDKPGARGAGSKYRHRLPGKLCQECHQM